MTEAATSGKEWSTLVVDSEKTKQITRGDAVDENEGGSAQQEAQ